MAQIFVSGVAHFFVVVGGSKIHERMAHFFMDIYKLFGDIGVGLLILHKQGCVVYAERVGKCFTVSQGVTIGKGHPNKEGRDAPVIGNNVRVCPNSVIFGGIDIGDNVVIGAGTVLNKSVPNNCTVVGNPAKIIKMNGEKCDFPLV